MFHLFHLFHLFFVLRAREQKIFYRIRVYVKKGETGETGETVLWHRRFRNRILWGGVKQVKRRGRIERGEGRSPSEF